MIIGIYELCELENENERVLHKMWEGPKEQKIRKDSHMHNYPE